MMYIDAENASRLAVATVPYTLAECVAAGPMPAEERAVWKVLRKAGYVFLASVGIHTDGREVKVYQITPFGRLALQLRNLARAEAA